MKYFLPRVMATLTGKPRQIVEDGVDFHWSTKSWTHNTFRVYELIFGRREGIRAESAGWLDEYGIGHQVGFTFEAKVALLETWCRGLFKDFAFKIVPVPQYAYAGLPAFKPSIFSFAIAFDNAVSGGLSNGTFAYTVTGTNPYIFPIAYGGNGNTTTLTTATYAGVNCVAGAIGLSDNSHISSIFGASLSNPATGSNTVVVQTSVVVRGSVASSYSGVFQGAVDATAKLDTVSTATTVSINTSTPNCWMMMFTIGQFNTPTAGTNATGRSLNDGQNVGPSAFDSNGVISTGGFSMTVSYTLGTFCAATAYTVTQAVSAVTVEPFAFPPFNPWKFFKAGSVTPTK